jgi:sporulation protein YlmC with PRC-barrel domain
MEYLESSDLELAVAADDVRGMAVVDLQGHRLGEVEDLVVDTHERRARLLAVASGGVLGLDPSRILIPVEAITKVDDRVHVAHSQWDVRGQVRSTVAIEDPDASSPERQIANLRSFAAAYERYELNPAWESNRSKVYFHVR